MAFRVVFAPTARDDLKASFVYLAEVAGIDVATAQDAKIRAACLALAHFPNRGRRRDDIRPGLRSVPFRRVATILYKVDEGEVRVMRVIHPRRDVSAAFDGD